MSSPRCVARKRSDSGKLFKGWRGQAIATGLVSQGLVRIAITGTTAREVERIGLGARVRDVVEGPDGALWVLTDKANAKLLRITPAR